MLAWINTMKRFGRIIFPLAAAVWFFNYSLSGHVSAIILALLFTLLAAFYWVEA